MLLAIAPTRIRQAPHQPTGGDRGSVGPCRRAQHVSATVRRLVGSRAAKGDMTWPSDTFEKRTASAMPPNVAKCLQTFGGLAIPALSMKLLTISESKRLMENWPRYGFSCDRGYVPIAEDRNGDLYCVACADGFRGQVFHLAWSGEETLRFASLQRLSETTVCTQNAIDWEPARCGFSRCVAALRILESASSRMWTDVEKVGGGSAAERQNHRGHRELT